MIDPENQKDTLEFEVPDPEPETLAVDDELGDEPEAPADEPAGGEPEPDEEEPAAEPDEAPTYTPEQIAAYAKEQLEAQGYKVEPPAPAEDEEPDPVFEPEAYRAFQDKKLAEREAQVEARILSQLEPVLRPVVTKQAEESLAKFVESVGIDMPDGLLAQIKAEIYDPTTTIPAIQNAIANPNVWVGVIADHRSRYKAPKGPSKAVGVSSSAGITPEPTGTTRVQLTRDEAEAWEVWKRDIGSTQQDMREFLQAHRGTK